MFSFEISRREALASIGAAATLPLVARATPAWARAATDAQASALLDSIADNLLRLSPEQATTLGIDTGSRAALRSRLSDRSAAGQHRVAATLKADLARAEALDSSALSFPVRTSVEVVKSAYRTALEGFAQPYGDVAVGGWRNAPYVVIQNVGAWIDVPRFLDSDHPVETKADAEAYLSRLEDYRRELDGELGRIQAARAMGLVPPAFLLDLALKPMAASARAARDGGGLVDSLVTRTGKKAIAGDWDARARKIVTGAIAPALERQIAELERERATATSDAGLWARPRGEDFYRWALKASTTTDMTPDDVHRMGLDQLAELQGRMDPILKSLGYTQGSVAVRMQALAKDPRYIFSDGDKGRAEIIAFVEQALARMRPKLPLAFHTLVRGNLEVRRLPPEEEPGAAGAYGGAGSIDGKVPGKIWLNLANTDEHRRYGLPTLAYHEGIPGHVWQGEYANQLPLIRTLLAFNAYSEGWALYSEQLADELGLYDEFPAGRLGYLQSLAFRACRLVIDTGIHAKRWSREQGVRFFVDRNGSNPDEASREVDRYCSWPGQACGYKVGHTTINRLRDKAKADLGRKFDLRSFDDAVVLGGNVPMDVLARNVDDYIRRATAA